MDEKILRIVDVNFNRAKEGLRVIEEVCRFVLEDPTLTNRVRSLKREIITTLSIFDTSFLRRESEKDLGKNFLPTPYPDFQKLVRANFSRIEESLRVLEEVLRLKNPKVSSNLMQIRFQCYSLEKDVLTALLTWEKLKLMEIYMIIDEETAKKDAIQVAREAMKGGVKFLQLRDKKSSLSEFIEKGKKIREITYQSNAIFIINDRIDVALCVDADGVHLGKKDFPIKDARKILSGKIIGASAHSLEEAQEMEKQGADYISLGPIFDTPFKPELKPLGLEILKEAKKILKVPLVAIGGINFNNLVDVLKTGVDGVAMIRNLQEKGEIRENCKKAIELLKKFKKLQGASST
ncbi:thiamine phosphate synthase [Candidatus Calescamantes bacterium]|nr:thiamine phosphate synthase [Candidatus Calescamantes bacterium]